MIIYKKTERIASIALLVLVAALCCAWGGAYVQQGLGLKALAIVCGIALLPALMTLFHATMARLAFVERDDYDAAKGDDALFAGDRSGSKVKQRNLNQFEHWMAPSIVIVIAIVELLSALFIMKTAVGIAARNGLIAPVAGAAGFSAVVLFLLGSYLVGLSFRGAQPMLRALAGEIVGLAWLAGLYALTTLLRLGITKLDVDRVFGQCLAILLIIRAGERVIAVVMEVYRPRKVKDGTSGLIYESKLNAIVADPRGVLGGVSDALHYQFGIRISEEGLLRLVTIGIPIVSACNLLFLLGFSSIVVINPGEQAVLERFGRVLSERGVLEPGLYVKYPWPIDSVYRRNIAEVRTATVGTVSKNERSLWTDVGAADIELFLTPATEKQMQGSSLNLLAVEMFIQYRISDVKQYIYHTKNPEAVLIGLGRREFTHVLAGKSFFNAFLSGRDEMCHDVETGLQKVLDARGLGISVISVGIRYLQPPPEIVVPYQDVVASGERRVMDVLDADRESRRMITEKKTEREGIISEAQSFRDQQVSVARADAANFTRLLPLYQKYGKLMKARTYFGVMDAVKDRRKIIIATDNDRQLIRLDLKKTKSELFDFTEETE